MIFTYPAFLIALGALAIPVIIHLFNLRKYKKVYFTNVRLLQDIQFETKAQSRLKHWLILLCRMLAITTLVGAFTMPFLPVSQGNTANVNKDKVVSIYIDNSFSMSAMDDDHVLLEQARLKARGIVSAFDLTTRFQLLTNDFKAAQQHFYKKDAIGEQLDAIEISPNFRTISAVFNRQKDLLNEHPAAEKSVFILSDFQQNTFDYHSIVNDTSIDVHLIPIVAYEPGNLFIDSVWFNTPIRQYGEQEELQVRIRNRSDNDYQNIPVKLYINSQQKTPGTINIGAHMTHEVALSFTNRSYGNHAGRVVLRDYPVTFDDQFFFNYTVDSILRILVINGTEESHALNALFKNDNGFELNNQSVKNIDFGSLSNYHLIILNGVISPSSGLTQELKKFIQASGNLLIFPPAEPDDDAYAGFLESFGLPATLTLDTGRTKVSSFNRQSEIFSNVFREIPENLNLPKVFKHYSIRKNRLHNSEELMKLANGDPLLEKFPYSKGCIYLFSITLDEEFSNFGKHSIFVPTLYNIALYSQSKQTLFHTIGKNTMVSIDDPANTETIYHLKGEQTDIIPELRITEDAHLLFFHDQIIADGNYLLESNLGNASTGIAFNYNREESYLEHYGESELQDILTTAGWSNFHVYDQENEQSMASLISFIHHGKPLWKYCLILALVFLGLEIILTKLWK